MSTRADAFALIVERHTAAKVEGYLIDATTAAACMAVYRALSPKARARFDEPPLPRLIDFVWKNVS